MSQPDFTSPPTLRVAAPKPKMTVYYGLLIIALLCLLTACLFLYLEIRRNWRENNGQAVPQRIAVLQRPDVYVDHRDTEDTENKEFVIGHLSFEIGHVGNGQMTNDQFAMTNLPCLPPCSPCLRG
jgi:hypothetical protein